MKSINEAEMSLRGACDEASQVKINERYNRNILLEQVGEEGQKKLLASKVLVCGAGGLGSTVLANLAAVGIGTIGVVDNDVVEISNLNRQYIHKFENLAKPKVDSAKEWINEFNPETIVNTYKIRLNEDNFYAIVKDYDLIVDCFDSFDSKFLLNKIAVGTGKILIHAGVSEFSGQVMTITPKKTACLECILPKNEATILKGVISPTVSLIASIQSMEVVKVILGIGETLENKLLSIDALSMKFKVINISKNVNCKLCN